MQLKRTFAIFSLIFSLILVLVLFIAPFFPVLSISNRKNPSEKVYFEKKDDGFSVSYTHSVNKGRVHDFYNSDGRNLFLYKSEFVSYGAGMPELEETPGAVFHKADGSYIMEYKRNVGKSFLLSVGVIAEHSIKIGNNEHFLKDFFKPKTSLVFEIKKLSIIEFLWYRRYIVK